MDNKGKLIIVSGPSGSGKGTILKKLFKMDPTLHYSISATTRTPRDGEKNGVEYYFVTADEFEQAVARDDMLEWADYCRNYYGTPLGPVITWTELGENVILEIEVEGAEQVIRRWPAVRSVFIMPPSMEELERRLRSRATESTSDTSMRLHKAELEIEQAEMYEKVIVNDDLDQAVEELYEFIHGDADEKGEKVC